MTKRRKVRSWRATATRTTTTTRRTTKRRARFSERVLPHQRAFDSPAADHSSRFCRLLELAPLLPLPARAQASLSPPHEHTAPERNIILMSGETRSLDKFAALEARMSSAANGASTAPESVSIGFSASREASNPGLLDAASPRGRGHDSSPTTSTAGGARSSNVVFGHIGDAFAGAGKRKRSPAAIGSVDGLGAHLQTPSPHAMAGKGAAINSGATTHSLSTKASGGAPHSAAVTAAAEAELLMQRQQEQEQQQQQLAALEVELSRAREELAERPRRRRRRRRQRRRSARRRRGCARSSNSARSRSRPHAPRARGCAPRLSTSVVSRSRRRSGRRRAARRCARRCASGASRRARRRGSGSRASRSASAPSSSMARPLAAPGGCKRTARPSSTSPSASARSKGGARRSRRTERRCASAARPAPRAEAAATGTA